MISESGVQGRKGEKQMRMRSKGIEGIEDEKEGDGGVRSRRMGGQEWETREWETRQMRIQKLVGEEDGSEEEDGS